MQTVADVSDERPSPCAPSAAAAYRGSARVMTAMLNGYYTPQIKMNESNHQHNLHTCMYMYVYVCS